MDWQATGDSWPGGQPDQDPGLPGRPGLPAGFDHGGAWAAAAPSAALAAALERAAGPEDLYDGRGAPTRWSGSPGSGRRSSRGRRRASSPRCAR